MKVSNVKMPCHCAQGQALEALQEELDSISLTNVQIEKDESSQQIDSTESKTLSTQMIELPKHVGALNIQ